MAERGFKMVFAPDAVVYHRHADRVRAYGKKKQKIAFWKTRVIRRHRAKARGDAHTPPTLAAEMGLVLLALLLAAADLAVGHLPIGLRAGSEWPLFGASALGSLLAAAAIGSAPILAVMRFPRDLAVALAAPALVVYRAACLLSGLLQGYVFLRAPGPPVRGGHSQEAAA
jgi:hypothetical protein